MTNTGHAAETYEAWYHTPRGAWIGGVEFSLLMELLQPQPGGTLLDVGNGTGYFSRRFAATGLRVTGIDPDPAMNRYARSRGHGVDYMTATALSLPFETEAFDYCSAVTSLCFIDRPQQAVEEMWRVCRRGMVLGLLNRRSLLYLLKRGRGGYRGARWDDAASACHWWKTLDPAAVVTLKTAVWSPGGGWWSRSLERLLPDALGWGGFLAVKLDKPRV